MIYFKSVIIYYNFLRIISVDQGYRCSSKYICLQKSYTDVMAIWFLSKPSYLCINNLIKSPVLNVKHECVTPLSRSVLLPFQKRSQIKYIVYRQKVVQDTIFLLIQFSTMAISLWNQKYLKHFN